MTTPSVPFTVRRNDHGLSETRGCLYVDGDSLVVETQTTVFGLWKREPAEHRLDLTDLDTVEHQRRLWGDRLTLCTRPMHLAAALPGANDGAFSVAVRRRDRQRLDTVLDRLDLWRI